MRLVFYTVLLALLGTAAVIPVLADVGEGWRYSYVYSFSSEGRSVSGTASLEVVRVLEDGRVRLRFESSFNDGIATVEKNMPAQAFMMPRIPDGDITGSFSYTKGGVSYTLTINEVGRLERTIGGRSYQSIVYDLSGTYSAPNQTISGEARLEVLAGSGIIYSLEGSVNSRRGTTTFNIKLVDANFDLNSLPAPQATSAGYMQSYFLQSIQLPDQASTFLINGLPNTQTPQKVGATAPDDAGIRAVIAGLVGSGALAAIAVVGVRRRRVEAPGVVKRHYV
jgi:hypothetical protein